MTMKDPAIIFVINHDIQSSSSMINSQLSLDGHTQSEMEKRADTADISVLFFLACANFLAVYLQIS